ncbi:MAG TPA: putative toxin-antitoxin system toxin component, PIN family [Casimicrobiaceae bacterium]|nr:putative toxin-antitoxin system toxin component, PIN family [Casimicrobiaceae bacterium]
MRIFLDTNVLVSAFASRGLCADLLELILVEHELVVGTQVLAELRRTLRQKIKLPAARCDEIDEFLREYGGIVAESVPPVIAAVDDDDARVLGQAIAGAADVFVTGDAAIQRLAKVERMRILSPRAFWNSLRSRA